MEHKLSTVKELLTAQKEATPNLFTQCEVAGIVYATDNYSLFHTMKENRNINPSSVQKIRESMIKDGWIGSPIKVNQSMEIIDGQHRFEAAKSLGLKIPFTMDALKFEHCISLNTTASTWSLPDYVNAYAQKGNQNYVNFRDLMEVYPEFPIEAVYTACGFSRNHTYISNVIKKGSVICGDKEVDKAIECLDWLREFNLMFDHTCRSNKRNRILCVALIYCFSCKKVNRERLKEAILENFNNIIKSDSVLTTLAQFDMFYKRKYRGAKPLNLEASYRSREVV